MHPIEKRIRSVPDRDAYESAKEAFPEKSDSELIAELMRIIAFVAVCWNDVIEGQHDPHEIFQRGIFTECDELAEYFPWPPE